MKKKKILFVCYGLGIGGIETCLINLINALPEDRFDIDLLLMNPEYASKQKIKREVNYLDSYQYVMNTTDTMQEIRMHGGIIRNLRKFFSYCLFRVIVKLRGKAWTVFRKLPKHYDIAIAYSQNDYSPYYVIDKVKADRKIMWYHNGAYEAAAKKYERDLKYYDKFDYIVAVSSDCKKTLKSKFKFTHGKLIVLHNICDMVQVKTNANAFRPISFKPEVINIVTVGRMTKEKGADLAVDVCNRLYKRGILFAWHWVGDGNQRDTIEHKVKKYGLQDIFIFEGNQTNPYPYIKNADLYVQPSYYEAFSTTVTEAKILNRPIITTDVGGMRDQIVDGESGLIVSCDVIALERAIIRLLHDESLRNRIQNNLLKQKYDVDSYLSQYYNTVLS